MEGPKCNFLIGNKELKILGKMGTGSHGHIYRVHFILYKFFILMFLSLIILDYQQRWNNVCPEICFQTFAIHLLSKRTTNFKINQSHQGYFFL